MKYFTALEDERLKTLWGQDLTVSEIAKRMGRSVHSVEARAGRLRLKGPGKPQPRKAPPRQRLWTANEDAYLREAWPRGVKIGVIMRDLNRTPGSIDYRINALGLTRSPEAAEPGKPRPSAEDRDKLYWIACQKLGGFPVLSINYPRKAA